MKIIEYRRAIDLTVQFEDDTIVKKAAYKEFSSGSIKNLNHPSIFDKGYMGEGKYKAWGKTKLTKVYNTWFGMMSRCYDEKLRTKQPTYSDVEICNEWHNFQNFAKWFEENYIDGFHLDKDIICPTCRIYSPETCVFVPRDINSLFTSARISKRNLPVGIYHLRGRYQVSTPNHGRTTYIGFYKTVEEAMVVYKITKEKYMREVSEIWKGRVDERVYQALANYIVEIAD